MFKSDHAGACCDTNTTHKYGCGNMDTTTTLRYFMYMLISFTIVHFTGDKALGHLQIIKVIELTFGGICKSTCPHCLYDDIK